MRRISYIDGIKGIGALMVFFTHYRMMGLFYPNHFFKENPFFRLIMSGDLAVHIFLIVSGFSIAMSIASKLGEEQALGGIKSVILKRYFRLLLPMTLLFIVEGILYLLNAFIPHEWVLSIGGNEQAMNAFQNLNIGTLPLAILLSPVGVNFGWLAPTWMLKYIFYGTFMVVVLRMGTNNLSFSKTICYHCLFACLLYFTSEYYVSVIVGNLLFEIRLKIKKNEFIALFLFAIGLFVFFTIKTNTNVVVAMLFMVSVLYSNVLEHILSLRPIVWLGSISFSLYIIHWPLICTFSIWGYNVFLFSNPYVNAVCLFGSTVLLLFLLSQIYTEYFEKRICAKIMTTVQKYLL